MQWMKSNKKFIVGLGVFLIFVGIGIFLVSNFEIDYLEDTIVKESLSAEEVWCFEGTLQWWRRTYITVTLPVAIFLVIAGAATLVSQYLISEFENMD